MKRLNQRGFAVTAILYSLATIICLVLLLILTQMSGIKKNNDDLVDSIKDQFSNMNQTITVNGIKIPVKKSYGATWARVFHHNNQNGATLFAASEVGHIDTPYKQSVLADMNGLKSKDGKFEFLLEYSELRGYNRWRQTDNPYTLTVANSGSTVMVPGYQAIQISWGGNYWGGLAKSTIPTSTYIDGSVGVSDWWYAIGAITPYGTAPNIGIPGPNSTTVSGSVDLWVRVDDYLGTGSSTVPTPPAQVVDLNFTQDSHLTNYFTKELMGSGSNKTTIEIDSGSAKFNAIKEDTFARMQLNTVATGLKTVDFTLGVWPGKSTAALYENYQFYIHNFQVLLNDGNYIQYYFTHRAVSPDGNAYSDYLPAPNYKDNFVIFDSAKNQYVNIGNSIPPAQYTEFHLSIGINGDIEMSTSKGHSYTVNVGTRKVVSVKLNPLEQWWGNRSYARLTHFKYSY